MSRIANKGLLVPLIFLCSLIQTLTLTPPPNNAILDMYVEEMGRVGGGEEVRGGQSVMMIEY